LPNQRDIGCIKKPSCCRGFFEELEKEYAMSRNLTQPEEIDLVLHEITKKAMEADMEMSDTKSVAKSTQEGWNTGSISPYRAAYMKAHGLVS
jgi:hypothetical protein